MAPAAAAPAASNSSQHSEAHEIHHSINMDARLEEAGFSRRMATGVKATKDELAAGNMDSGTSQGNNFLYFLYFLN